jgi:hypothetical protein
LALRIRLLLPKTIPRLDSINPRTVAWIVLVAGLFALNICLITARPVKKLMTSTERMMSPWDTPNAPPEAARAPSFKPGMALYWHRQAQKTASASHQAPNGRHSPRHRPGKTLVTAKNR